VINLDSKSGADESMEMVTEAPEIFTDMDGKRAMLRAKATVPQLM